MRPDPRTIAAFAAFLATSVVLLTAVLAAGVGGSWELEERDFQAERRDRPTEAVEADRPPVEELEPPPPAAPVDWRWLGIVGRILLAGLVALAVWWVWLWLRQRELSRRRAVHDIGAAGTADEEPELPVLRRGVAEAQRFLEEIAGPTDAIIAAWLALEEAATASGVRRAPAQTPTEFTVAVLQRTAADPDATTELLSLYHRARFSGEPILAADVTRASRCFGTLAASWDALAGSDEGAS